MDDCSSFWRWLKYLGSNNPPASVLMTPSSSHWNIGTQWKPASAKSRHPAEVWIPCWGAPLDLPSKKKKLNSWQLRVTISDALFVFREAPLVSQKNMCACSAAVFLLDLPQPNRIEAEFSFHRESQLGRSGTRFSVGHRCYLKTSFFSTTTWCPSHALTGMRLIKRLWWEMKKYILKEINLLYYFFIFFLGKRPPFFGKS